VSHVQSYRTSWQGTLRDLAQILAAIRRAHAFGRLTLRNEEALSVAHLYFYSGKLVHIISNRGNAAATLNDLQKWTRATVRFVRGTPPNDRTVSDEQEQTLDTLIVDWQRRGIVGIPRVPRVVDGGVVASRGADQLIAPQEWRVLVEGTRRISLAVAHLVGPIEALSVLRDVLDDCTAGFPAFASLQIAPSGYLQVTDTARFDRVPRGEMLDGFAALFSICQYFCAPIIGDSDAHKLMIQALGDVGPALVNLGVFHIDRALLAGKQPPS
jgi:hypothetical protein